MHQTWPQKKLAALSALGCEAGKKSKKEKTRWAGGVSLETATAASSLKVKMICIKFGNGNEHVKGLALQSLGQAYAAP